jgi:histidinol-phosphate aminotransferase
MADAVTPKTKMIFIANPNNPTGTINKKDEFDRMMKRIPDNVLVVIDEAYIEYVADPDYADSMKHFREGREVLILRTFSKIYGLAGLRIGYGIANRNITVEMNKLRPPFNTSSMAQKAALAALGDEDHLKSSRKVNEQGRSFLYKELDALGMKYVPTEANFIYMPLERSAQELNDKLLKKGVIIRPMGPREIRVTIGLPEENRRFIEALKEVVSQ